jgi:hypothetical protein
VAAREGNAHGTLATLHARRGIRCFYGSASNSCGQAQPLGRGHPCRKHQSTHRDRRPRSSWALQYYASGLASPCGIQCVSQAQPTWPWRRASVHDHWTGLRVRVDQLAVDWPKTPTPSAAWPAAMFRRTRLPTLATRVGYRSEPSVDQPVAHPKLRGGEALKRAVATAIREQPVQARVSVCGRARVRSRNEQRSSQAQSGCAPAGCDRIPHSVMVWDPGHLGGRLPDAPTGGEGGA